MGDIVLHNVVSVDGFIADGNDDIGPLFDWYFNGETTLTDGGDSRVSGASAAYVQSAWDSVGSMVIGRYLFDIMNGWDGRPPVGDHVVSCRTGPNRTAGIRKPHTNSSTT